MSPETLLLDRLEEKSPVASRKSEGGSEDAVSLLEDTTLSHIGRLSWGDVRQVATLSEDGGEVSGEVVRIIFDESLPPGGSRTPLRASLEALSDLRAGGEVVDWLEAATVLKRDVVRLRDTNYSRHAAVLLALADALTFTEPAEVLVAEDAKPLFRHALGLLSEPYISEASEEEFLGQLLMAGWNLAPSKEQALELVD